MKFVAYFFGGLLFVFCATVVSLFTVAGLTDPNVGRSFANLGNSLWLLGETLVAWSLPYLLAMSAIGLIVAACARVARAFRDDELLGPGRAVNGEPRL